MPDIIQTAIAAALMLAPFVIGFLVGRVTA